MIAIVSLVVFCLTVYFTNLGEGFIEGERSKSLMLQLFVWKCFAPSLWSGIPRGGYMYHNLFDKFLGRSLHWRAWVSWTMTTRKYTGTRSMALKQGSLVVSLSQVWHLIPLWDKRLGGADRGAPCSRLPPPGQGWRGTGKAQLLPRLGCAKL